MAARVRSIRRNGAPALRITGPPHITRIRIADFLSRVLIVRRSERIVRRNALTLRRLNCEATRVRRPRHVLTPHQAADIQRRVRVIVPVVGARIMAVVVVAVPRVAVADRVAAEVGHAAAEAAVTMEAVVRLALVNFPI